jgi:hypothetical protein
MFTRTLYSQRPPREEYHLTQKGLEVLPVLVSLGVWGNRWLAPEGALFDFVDPKTGTPVEPVLTDRLSGRELTPGSVALVAGPGASPGLRATVTRPLVLGATEVAA